MDGGGVSVPVQSSFVRSGMVAKGIKLHEKRYTRRTTGNRRPGFKLWTVFSLEYQTHGSGEKMLSKCAVDLSMSVCIL